MIIVNTVEALQDAIKKQKSAGKKIGFVPTMGALHEGHLTLIRYAKNENDFTVCSVFVNPTQFNEQADLEKYPRTLDKDAVLLESAGCDMLFAPPVEEVYPEGTHLAEEYTFGGLEDEMEGAHRPGHFQGVGQVVHRLLDIVQPYRLYMGQKDFQQFTLIQYMIEHLSLPVQLRIAPIVREADGLAMSSRNVRLTPLNRAKAFIIYRTLQEFKELNAVFSVKELVGMAMAQMKAIDDFRPEYFTVADGRTLKRISNLEGHDYVIVATAVWAGDVRLIDNVILKRPEGVDLFIE